MNSLAESLLGGPPDPAKPSFLDFPLGPPPSPHPLPQPAPQQQPPPQHPASLAPYPLQALHPPPQHDGGAFPSAAPTYGRPLAYPAYPGPAAAGGSPHAFYHHHHHHHGASYSPYQQPSSALGHGTRLEETAENSHIGENPPTPTGICQWGNQGVMADG
ncbi:UNVERIFIED_CONTAM: hypothetical protein K2H54_023068 [Gekko kuhli]